MGRFAPVNPDLAALWESLGSAYGLYVVLIDLQCDAEGRINYGRPFGYAWLLARWPGFPDDRPCVRSLKYHMAKLKKAGLVNVQVRGHGGGMKVTMINSPKWANKPPTPAVQLTLFSPAPSPIRCEKPVQQQRKSSELEKRRGQEFAPVNGMGGKGLPRKEVKNLAKETIRTVANTHSMPRLWKTEQNIDARRRFLHDQLDMLEANSKTSYSEKAKAKT